MRSGARFVALAAAAVVGLGTLAAERAGHRVVVETVSRVELEVWFPVPTLFADERDGETWSRVVVPGTRTPERPGAALPEYAVVLAVPRGTVPVVRLRAPIEVALPTAPPPAVLEWSDDGTALVARARRDDDRPEAVSPAPVEVQRLGVVRHVELARVVVRPARFERGTWFGLRSAGLSVEFAPAAEAGERSAIAPDTIDRAIGLTVANPGVLAESTSIAAGAAIPAPEPSVMSPVKVVTVQAGLHEIRRSDLDAAGVDVAGIDPATFVLTHRGLEIAIEVEDGGDGSFDAPGDCVRFYTLPVGGEETVENVYRLTGGVRTGLRLAARDATPDPLHTPAVEFTNVAREEINTRYWGSLPDDVASPWYGSELAIVTLGNSVHAETTFSLTNVSTATALSGELRVRVQSRRETPGPSPNHHVRIYLNGNLVDDRTWTGLQGVTLSGPVPPSWIVEGANTVRVQNVADLGLTAQTEWIDWIELTYRDRYVAEGDYLQFTVDRPGPRRTALSGFTASDVRLYDVSSPQAPVRLTGIAVAPDGGLWSAEFSDTLDAFPGTVVFAAVTGNAAKRPVRFERDTEPTALRDAAPAGADLLIVVHDSLHSAILPLAAHREAQGLRTVVAKVGDVYDEFNGGIREVQGVRNFVQWAFENYAPPAPAYLLVVGDATLDPANFRGEGDNLVSTQFFRAPQFGLAPTDTWLAAVSGADLIPDLAVGRIGARTAADVDRWVANLLAYETNPPVAELNGRLLYVADDDDPYFETINEDLIARFQPPGREARRVYLDDYPQTTAGVDAATLDIRAALDAGALATVYTGHGGRTLWANEALWTVADVAGLAPSGRLTFAMALSCVNGYFTNLDAEPFSLGEEWGRLADRGAVGNFATSASGTLLNFDLLSDRVFEHLFTSDDARIGMATWRGLVDTHVLDGVPVQYVRQMVHFGDPTAMLALDTDLDGRLDREESAAGTSALDSDSDDDGLADGAETGWNLDDDLDGRVNAADPDADDDGLPDGLEAGIVVPPPDTDVAAGQFVPDADPATTTNSRALDSDGGGAPDGAEDRDANGRVDAGESDPLLTSDDPACASSVPEEVAGVVAVRDGSDVVLSWDAIAGGDPCALYRVYAASGPAVPNSFEAFAYVATTGNIALRLPGAAADPANGFYLVTGWSPATGEGVLGHYGR